MEVIRLGNPCAVIPDACVTALGFFDGVHRGHAALLRRTASLAHKYGYTPAVFTFAPEDEPYKAASERLTTAEERLSLFASCGITHVFYAAFSSVRDLSPEDFVRRILIDTCHTILAVSGYNFRFGRGAAGTAADLRCLMRAQQYDAQILPPRKRRDGTPISSSAIRACIQHGEMPAATEMLGRRYSLTATVLHGKELGRTIGYPTINQLFPPDAVIPAHGVYDVLCEVDGLRYHGLANVGTRPTVGGTGVNCETYLIGYHGDLYGRSVTILFERMLRPEMRFRSVKELQEAITKNLEEMKETYGNRMDKAYRPRRPRRP